MCGLCMNEFRADVRTCRFCHAPLSRRNRRAHEAELARRPLFTCGEAIAAGPERVPKDLVRVHVARSLRELRSLLAEFRLLGVAARAGSDSLDPFTDPGSAGIYVREGDRETAEYVIAGHRESDPLGRPPSDDVAAPDPVLEEAEAWIGFGKFRQALALLEPREDEGPVALLVTEALLRAGRIREAGRRAERAAGTEPDSAVRARILERAGLAHALGHDGTPFGAGCDLDRARDLLCESVALAPRRLEAGKTLAEVLDALGDRVALARELSRLGRVNRNFLGVTGWFRETATDVGVS